MSSSDLAARLLFERGTLGEHVCRQREQLDRLRAIVDDLEARLTHDEHVLSELEGILGVAAQLRLEPLDERLRGQRLEEVAVAVLREDRGAGSVVHYRDWFALLRAQGHHVAGKDPLGTFLTQINRSPHIERVGRRTGQYRLAAA